MISFITSSTTDPWFPTRFPYQLMFLSFNSKTTGTSSGERTAYTSVA